MGYIGAPKGTPYELHAESYAPFAKRIPALLKGKNPLRHSFSKDVRVTNGFLPLCYRAVWRQWTQRIRSRQLVDHVMFAFMHGSANADSLVLGESCHDRVIPDRLDQPFKANSRANVRRHTLESRDPVIR